MSMSSGLLNSSQLRLLLLLLLWSETPLRTHHNPNFARIALVLPYWYLSLKGGKFALTDLGDVQSVRLMRTLQCPSDCFSLHLLSESGKGKATASEISTGSTAANSSPSLESILPITDVGSGGRRIGRQSPSSSSEELSVETEATCKLLLPSNSRNLMLLLAMLQRWCGTRWINQTRFMVTECAKVEVGHTGRGLSLTD